jgi:hypothetical protein
MSVNRYSAPAQRELAASMFTVAGWITGSFLIPKLRHFSDFLNQPQEFFKLKAVRLPGLEKELPFFVLQRNSIIFVVPADDDDLVPAVGGEKLEREVSCAFANGVVSGTLDVLKGVRVSDFLMSRAGLFVLRNCSTFIRTGATPEVRHNIPYVIVNSERVIGVSEPRFV